MSRARPLLLSWLVAMSACVAFIVWHAHQSRTGQTLAASHAFVRATGLFDPCLSTTSRWLRHPHMSEGTAALHDHPGLPDIDPAGAWIVPVERTP